MPRQRSTVTRLLRAALSVSVPAIALPMVVGCEVKSWIDPSELGRLEQEPLVVNILDKLDTRYEEPTSAFGNATDIEPRDLVIDSSDYVIGRNDLVSVSITDLVGPGVETVKTARVSESGNISLPLVGQVSAVGLTEAQLEQRIIETYRNAELIQNAQVSVTVAEARARTFSVLGTVGAPGEYAIVSSDFRLLNALVVARGAGQDVEYIYVIRQPESELAAPAPEAAPLPAPGAAPVAPTTPAQPGDDLFEPRSSIVLPNRPVSLMQSGEGATPQVQIEGQPVPMPTAEPMVAEPAAVDAAPAPTEAPATAPVVVETAQQFEFQEPGATPEPRVIRVPLDRLTRGELQYNIVIRPKDLIYVPSPVVGEFYMSGHVNRVGVYSLTGRKITVKQAIVSAGMLDPLAIPQRTEIIRRTGPNQEVFVRIDLAAIWEGRQPDIYLKPNDIVHVGTNAFAPFIASLRGAFRFTYGFGFLYDRNFADNDRNNL